MKQTIVNGLLLVGFVVIIQNPADAQARRRPGCDTCNKRAAAIVPPPVLNVSAVSTGTCETCNMPAAQCTITRTRPVVQTELRPQQVTTYCDVAETRVRNETVVTNVPVTTCKTVTVDEGGYQMVWVPKPVTKQVAQTVVQQQVSTRAVPYTVTRKVPQVSTQMVPVQTVHHVTETVPVAPIYGSPYISAAPAYPQPFTASLPTASPIQTMPEINVPLPKSNMVPVPTRPSPQNRESGSPTSRMVPEPSDDLTSSPINRSPRFVPAPSAATVWSSRMSR